MSTRPFAPSTYPITAVASRNALRSLAIQPVIALCKFWQAEVDRRRRTRMAEDLHAMSNHALNDIGVARSTIDWVAHQGR